MIRKILLTSLAVLSFVSIVIAADTNCPEHFAGGKAPDLLNSKRAVMAREICYSGYAVMHSGVTRTPIYTAEHLTKERLLKAKELKRKNSFHPDENIPKSERAEINYYAKSGYDRGHMAPSADMSDEQSQYESFSLANMVPQNPNNNRGVWARLESKIRRIVREHGEVYVITGTVFNNRNPKSIENSVMIPSSFFKAVYVPATRTSEVHLVENSESENDISISLMELEQLSGLEIFPGTGIN